MTRFALMFRLPIIFWQALFFIGPLVFVVVISFYAVRNYQMVEAFEFKSWDKMLSRSYVWDAYWRTLGLAALTTVIASLVAFPASFYLAFRSSEAVRRWVIFFLIIPFFTSYLVRSFSWYTLLAESGVLNAILGQVGLGPYVMLNTPFGTIVGYLTLTLPLVLILQTVSLANIDMRLVQAAWNLGCSPLRTIWSVVLPSARTGLMIAALFCFLLSYGDVVAPYYLGGSKPPTMPILIIDTTKAGQQWPRAAVVAVLMIVTLFMVAFTTIILAYRRRRS
ncbi:MAG: ABC transporter permease [Pseudomonadota bacterium]